MNRKAEGKKLVRLIVTFAAVFAAVYVIYLILGLAPFGGSSFTHRDGDIQMLDFLRCYKRFLSGDGSMLYSFSKGLGDNMYPLFTYYLASPVNLLVVFWNYDSIPAFVDFAVAVKLALAATAFEFYMENRYELSETRQIVFSELLSCCYAFCTFGISAGCFLPFLEGLVFLPVMAAGVYKAVEGRSRILLSAGCALAVICNWYMGAICCLYSVVILACDLFSVRRSPKEILSAVARYTVCMAEGLLISAVVLFPTLVALGSHGGLDITGLFIPEIYGNPLSFITNYKPLSISDMANPAVFAGSFVLIMSVVFFAARKPLRAKITYGAALLFTVSIFYFRPLVNIFLLLRENTAFAYGYRYAFAASFLLCFIAAEILAGPERDAVRPLPVAITGGLFAAVILISDISGGNTTVTVTGVGLIVLITVFAALMQSGIRTDLRKIMTVFVLVLCVAEVGLHVIVTIPLYSTANVESYKQYSDDQARLKEDLPKEGFYRITQNAFRDENLYKGLTCCYNDPLAYGYNGLTSYSSAQSDRAGLFMDRSGYHYSAATMNIVNTSNLAADSFLGVKYAASTYSMPGLIKTGDKEYNSMSVYKNPYALDLAFTIPSDVYAAESIRGADYFEYNNKVWSLITGEDIRIFDTIGHDIETGDGSVRYSFNSSSEDSLYYGYISFPSARHLSIDVNGAYETAYYNWLAPSVFHIPGNGVSSYVDVPDTEGEAVFARLDLKELQRVSELVRANSGKVDVNEFKDGHVRITAESAGGGYLCVTVPYDEQWKVTVNGKKAETVLLADTFFLIPLEEGQNTVQMDYSVRYLIPSLMVSTAVLIIVVVTEIIIKAKKRGLRGNTGEQK